MGSDLTSSAGAARERVIVFLAFLTSEACRAAFRDHVAHEAWAAALCRVWFDEIYVPGERYLHGLKGDRSAAAVAAFDAAFTGAERAALERFHGCLELRLDLLANRRQGRGRLPENDSWRSILRDARAVLAELVPDPARLQALVATLAATAPEDLAGTPPWRFLPPA